MTKLKKLFPLSFKFCNKPSKLLLGAVIYLAIAIAAGWVISFISGILTAPLMIFAIPYIGWLLALLCLPIIILWVTVVDIAVLMATTLVKIYIYAGIAVSIVAYATTEEELPEAETIVADELSETAADETAEEAAEEATVEEATDAE